MCVWRTEVHDVSAYLDPCVAPPFVGLDCLIIREPYYLAYIAATCVSNAAGAATRSAAICLLADTADAGEGYGKWIHYYASSQGCTRSSRAHTCDANAHRTRSRVCVPLHSYAVSCAAPRLLGLELSKRSWHNQRRCELQRPELQRVADHTERALA